MALPRYLQRHLGEMVSLIPSACLSKFYPYPNSLNFCSARPRVTLYVLIVDGFRVERVIQVVRPWESSANPITGLDEWISDGKFSAAMSNDSALDILCIHGQKFTLSQFAQPLFHLTLCNTLCAKRRRRPS